MVRRPKTWLADTITGWLTREQPAGGSLLCDFDRIRFEIRPADVLLVEGRSRVSDVIKTITQSPWSHSALYLGRPSDITDPRIRSQVRDFYDGDDHEQLILEALLGQGTVIAPLSRYRQDHVRICRPKGLSPADAQEIIAFAVHHLGWEYDLRQLLDLARFLLPWSVLPRRWRSSLFQHSAGGPTRTVCSSLLASAFASVHYPIRPVIQRTEAGDLRLYRRNFRLLTPSDFDYSPYFDIIKYPYLGFDDVALYRRLPWDEEGVVCNDSQDCWLPPEAATEGGRARPSGQEPANERSAPRRGSPAAVNLLGRAPVRGDTGGAVQTPQPEDAP